MTIVYICYKSLFQATRLVQVLMKQFEVLGTQGKNTILQQEPAIPREYIIVDYLEFDWFDWASIQLWTNI
jgi:hypothetical protein